MNASKKDLEKGLWSQFKSACDLVGEDHKSEQDFLSCLRGKSDCYRIYKPLAAAKLAALKAKYDNF